MHIIKLNATQSTNSFLKEKYTLETLEDFTVVVTESQTHGRGQRAAVWQSEPGKNLTFSVLKRFEDVKVTNQFYVNMVVSLAITNTLKKLSVPDVFIKWPNDILSESYKVCGILIENLLFKDTIRASVIGVGLNINQMVFNDLPKAASLKKITGVFFDLDEVLYHVLQHLKYYFAIFEKINGFKILKAEYETQLFKRNRVATFLDSKENAFTGIIQGISSSGRLEVLLEGKLVKEFDLKELKLLY